MKAARPTRRTAHRNSTPRLNPLVTALLGTLNAKTTFPMALALSASSLSFQAQAANILCPISSDTHLTGTNTNATTNCQINTGVTLTNAGALTNNWTKTLTNSGTLTNLSGATLTNGWLAKLNNSGTLNTCGNESQDFTVRVRWEDTSNPTCEQYELEFSNGVF